MNFFQQQVNKALINHAFPYVENLENYHTLPYQEPRFRFMLPNEMISETHGNGTVYVSKKPEGEREIFVGVYDRVEKVVHFFTVCRNKRILHVPSVQIMPFPLSNDLRQKIENTGSLTPFVFDVCRVLDTRTRMHVNVLLSDIGPLHLDKISMEDQSILMNSYNIVRKLTIPYHSGQDIETVVSASECFPYHPENGIIFVQSTSDENIIHPKSPCAKYTLPVNASVYFFVEPIITLRARLWKLMYLGNKELVTFKTIPAQTGFYVPPTGAVVSFGIHVNEEGYWRFYPKHIRLDKSVPSVLNTIQQFISRYVSHAKTLNAVKESKEIETENENAFDD
jgi:hypothetical protein